MSECGYNRVSRRFESSEGNKERTKGFTNLLTNQIIKTMESVFTIGKRVRVAELSENQTNRGG